MNKKRKENIKLIRKNIEKIAENLRTLLDEEQEYYDNIPENLQGCIRASESEDSIDILEECIENLENIINKMMEI